MKNKPIICLFLLIIVGIGCSSGSPGKIKPDHGQISPTVETPVPETVMRDLYREDITKKMTFPLTDNFFKLNSLRAANMPGDLTLYWKAEGGFPENLKEYVTSGFPLIWPRDLYSGNPISVRDFERDFDSSKPYFDSLMYHKINEDKAQLVLVDYDIEANQSGGDLKWKIKKDDFPPEWMISDSEKIIYGSGTISIEEVADKNKRRLYAWCAGISSYCTSRTSRYVNYNDSLPQSLEDLLDATQFFIKENFSRFVDLLQASNADFMWGFDYSKNVEYVYLEVDGDVLMMNCTEWLKNSTPNPFECNIKDYDLTTPLLSTDILASLEFPEDYVTSINDIQFDN
ncbi:hypothetical protein KKB99_08325 [bacterium]|nr:hypothetical protein [bacterium]MBU1025997.1 hypothetical protein [bacterium]